MESNAGPTGPGAFLMLDLVPLSGSNLDGIAPEATVRLSPQQDELQRYIPKLGHSDWLLLYVVLQALEYYRILSKKVNERLYLVHRNLLNVVLDPLSILICRLFL